MSFDDERLGYDTAIKEAHFIAAPLLTAAALSLAGVVAGADEQFLWPGPTLLLLVTTALTLLGSIQLSYYARQFLFTYQELEQSWVDRSDMWHGMSGDAELREQLLPIYKRARARYRRFALYSVHSYNSGTVLLGLGIAASLAPPSDGKQVLWRWIAAGLVAVCTIAETVWIRRMYKESVDRS
ncbi:MULTISPECIES: hypothetical protein [Streptomyces]|uniref:hypothetical protein n=1 Tax=Streptomyces TaxID=1883 RepID=UPI00167D8312|nr:hypothetical protein [Streptomyces umbrinus]MCR3725734.1 hypothetical protein [Streptomyces umbrinus]GHH49042.1 hypothetical protein GCM10018775_44080 [Streptomyces umbrinus]